MLDTGLKFYAVPSRSTWLTLRSRSQIYVKVLGKDLEAKHDSASGALSCPVTALIILPLPFSGRWLSVADILLNLNSDEIELFLQTRMQSLVPDPKANYRNVPDALVKIFRHEGLKNTVRGINALVIGAGPAHALYFACYEKLKKVLSGGKHGNHLANGKLRFL